MARGSTASQGRAARSEVSDRLRARADALDAKARQVEAKEALRELKLKTIPATEFYKSGSYAKEQDVRAMEAGTEKYAQTNRVPTSKQLLGLSGLDAESIKGAIAVGDPVVTRVPNKLQLEVSQTFQIPYTTNDDGSVRPAWYVMTMKLNKVPKTQKVKLSDLVYAKSGATTTLGQDDGNRMKYKGRPVDESDL